ncbi:hypothetical protein V8F20_003759 [Naviculisporaceae sp. PSN 640]
MEREETMINGIEKSLSPCFSGWRLALGMRLEKARFNSEFVMAGLGLGSFSAAETSGSCHRPSFFITASFLGCFFSLFAILFQDLPWHHCPVHRPVSLSVVHLHHYLSVLFQTSEGGTRDGIFPNHPDMLGSLAPFYSCLKDSGWTDQAGRKLTMESSVVYSPSTSIVQDTLSSAWPTSYGSFRGLDLPCTITRKGETVVSRICRRGKLYPSVVGEICTRKLPNSLSYRWQCDTEYRCLFSLRIADLAGLLGW